jgi:hypothetical protein
MMGRLEQGQGQLFYSFCLEEVVPEDHQVRAISSVLDLSWVYGELSPHYPALGRPSIDPVLHRAIERLGAVVSRPVLERPSPSILQNLIFGTHTSSPSRKADSEPALSKLWQSNSRPRLRR